MTTSTAALDLSARMTHQTPAGHVRKQVREIKLKYITFSGEICSRRFSVKVVNSPVGSNEMKLMMEARIH